MNKLNIAILLQKKNEFVIGYEDETKKEVPGRLILATIHCGKDIPVDDRQGIVDNIVQSLPRTFSWDTFQRVTREVVDILLDNASVTFPHNKGMESAAHCWLKDSTILGWMNNDIDRVDSIFKKNDKFFAKVLTEAK